jgi:Aspartyl protease
VLVVRLLYPVAINNACVLLECNPNFLSLLPPLLLEEFIEDDRSHTAFILVDLHGVEMKKRATCVCILFLTACSAHNLRDGSSVEVLKLERFSGALKLVKVSVNNHPLNLIFDTGAGINVLSTKAAETVGCTIFGEDTGFGYDGTQQNFPKCGPIDVQLGSAHTRTTAIVGDFFGDALPVDGMISLNALRFVPFELDLRKDELILHTIESARQTTDAMEWKSIPIQIGAQAGGDELDLFIGIEASAHNLWFEFDTGSTQPLLLRQSSARLLSVTTDTPAVFLPFATEVATKFEVRDNLIYDGLLGGSEISKRRWLFDLHNAKGWVRSEQP